MESGMHIIDFGGGEKFPKVTFQLIKNQQQIQEEEIPLRQQEEEIFTEKQTENQNMKYKAKFLINEDPKKSRFLHAKIVIIQKFSCLLTALIFFLSVCKTELDMLGGDINKDNASSIMNTISICIVALMLVILLRYFCLFELQHQQNKVYVGKIKHQWKVTLFLKWSGKISNLLLQFLLILPHPISTLQGCTFTLFQTYDEIYLKHSYNDLLSMLLIAKVYIIIRSLINITGFSSPRASRLCNQNGFQHNTLYIVKCILHQNPLLAIAANFIIYIFIFGYALKLSEGVLFLYNAGFYTGLETYQNCFWCIFCTMSTVGYGDYYPKTLPGRFIILITAICGVLLSSLLIVSLSLYLQMNPGQSKSHVTLLRLQEQKEISEQASQALASTLTLHKLMSRPQGYNEQDLRNCFLQLKNDIDAVKSRSKKIKSIVDTDNMVEQMNRLFYILKDSLRQIFRGQVKLRNQIGKIEEIQSIKISFIREVSDMLSKKVSNLSN